MYVHTYILNRFFINLYVKFEEIQDTCICSTGGKIIWKLSWKVIILEWKLILSKFQYLLQALFVDTIVIVAK